MKDRELLEMARQAAKHAHVPYSKFPVGAALECCDGTVFTGCNIENSSLGSTICAERTAFCKAVSEGKREFMRIAIVGESENYCMPCGACLQFMYEFAPNLEIMCTKVGGRYVSYKLHQLMPHPFEL